MSTGPVTASQILQQVQTATQSDSEKIQAKRDEVTAVENKQLAYNNIDSIMESLEESLEALTKESTFNARSTSSSNAELVTATANSGAAKTSFVLTNITQLAKSAMVTSSNDLNLSEGSGPTLVSASDITISDDYNPNLIISSDDQGVSPAITSGTFTINGVNIDIAGNDTLYDILTSINNAGAGVVATFDAATDTVRISGTSIGADETISFDSGETNIFEALNMTSSSAGADGEKDQSMAGVSAFSGVSNGYFNINNFTFYINKAEDSLEDIIGRVNASNCGAVMFFDEDTGKVTITNQEEGDPLILNNDTSGFLSAIGVIDQGDDQDADAGESVYYGQKAQFELNGESITKDSNNFTIGGVNFTLVGTTSVDHPSATITVTPNRQGTIEQINNFVEQFNATLSVLDSKINPDEDADDADKTLEGDNVLKRLMTNLRTSLFSSIDNPGQYNSLVDIGLSFERKGGELTLVLDEETLESRLEADETSVRMLFAFNNDSDGLLDDGGYAVTTTSTLNSYTRSVSGFFYKRNDQLIDIIERMELKIYAMEEDLIDKQERLFNTYVQQVTALQDLQQQQAEVSQTSSQLLQTLGL